MDGRYVDARRQAAPAIPVVPSTGPPGEVGRADVPDDPELRQWRRLLEPLFVPGRDVAAIAERARIHSAASQSSTVA